MTERLSVPNRKQKLRVLRLSPAIHRPGRWPAAYDPVGGLQMQVWRLTEQLSRMGVQQTVCSSHIPGSPRVRSSLENTTIRSVGPWLPESMSFLLQNFGWFLGILPELLFRAQRHDIVHVHFNHSIWCRIAVLVARARGIPTIASMNTSLWGGLKDALAQLGPSIRVTEFIDGLALRAATRVIALTESDLKRKAEETKLDHRFFTVVPDGIDLVQFTRMDVPDQVIAEFRAQYGIPADAHVATYVGRISAEKGWNDLPQFLTLLASRNVFLLVCGDGPDRRKLEVTMRKSLKSEQWRITGFLPPEDVRVALRASDVLVLPSRREAFGGVLLEAMASGLPSIAYDVGGIGEVAGHPPAVRLVQKGDVKGLADAFLDLVDNEASRLEITSRGNARARDFAIENVAAKTLAVYLSACDKSG